MNRRDFLKLAAILGISGCQSVQSPVIVKKPKEEVSYELGDLCDTEIKEKDLTLHVYISPSERLWDYQDYRDELFGYLKAFFASQKINCHVKYSDSKFKAFTSSNEIGIEVLDSEQAIIKRYFEFSPLEKENPDIREELEKQKGYAATRKGIALINANWEEFRPDSSRKDIGWYSEPYKGITLKEYILRNNAGNIAHEVFHCLGFWHPGDFIPELVAVQEEGIPNVLSYGPAKFSEEYPLGYTISLLQQKLLHSSIAGNNFYKAFANSNRDLEIFVQDIARANYFILRSKI